MIIVTLVQFDNFARWPLKLHNWSCWVLLWKQTLKLGDRDLIKFHHYVHHCHHHIYDDHKWSLPQIVPPPVKLTPLPQKKGVAKNGNIMQKIRQIFYRFLDALESLDLELLPVLLKVTDFFWKAASASMSAFRLFKPDSGYPPPPPLSAVQCIIRKSSSSSPCAVSMEMHQ